MLGSARLAVLTRQTLGLKDLNLRQMNSLGCSCAAVHLTAPSYMINFALTNPPRIAIDERQYLVQCS